MKTTTLIAAVLAALTLAAQAAEVIKPQIGEPLRDPSICKGPDGTYYLTGTSPYDAGERPLDFRNNAGVKLWKSKDLKSWEPIGWAVHLPTHWKGSPDTEHTAGVVFVPAGVIDSPQCYGLTQPEIHCIKGNWWITYSQNGRAASLLRSTSGKPEGPYEFHAYHISEGYSPSLFQDDDGSVYWITGGGWIAKMTDDMKKLAESPRPVRVAGGRDRVGSDGAFVVKRGGRYYLFATDIAIVKGKPGRHLYVAEATNITGPYANRRLVFEHAEQATLFPAGAGDGAALSAIYYCPQPDQERLVIAPLSLNQ